MKSGFCSICKSASVDARRERPPRLAAEKRDELAAYYVGFSSAVSRARSA